MQMFDVVTVGDAIVDLLITLSPEGQHYHMEHEKKELALMLGEKIPVEKSSFSLGGNAAHVAIGLSRLGLRTALVAEIGDDEFAEKITKDLEKEKVSMSLLLQTKNAPSTFSVSVSVNSDRTIFVRHVEREHHLSFDSVEAKWVYLTSMGEKWEEMYQKTLAFCQKTGAKLAFNPGSMQMKKGIDSFSDIVKLCDILFVNKEEAEEILYREVLPPEKKEPAESLLFRLNRMGPKIVVITDGENGSYAIDADAKVYTQHIFKAHITEKTGAGDAFSTGFLSAMVLGKDIQTCLQWGTADAAGVVSKLGGQQGLLTKSELESKIAENL